MDDILKINGDEVKNLLKWDQTIAAVKQALVSITNSSNNCDRKSDSLMSVLPQRTFTRTPSGVGYLLTMPSYIQGLSLGGNDKCSTLACKLVTVFDGNPSRDPPLPAIDGVVLLFDSETGKLKAFIDAEELTKRRTAAVSCAAVQLLRGREMNEGSKVLGIMGAGNQGVIHALAFADQFQFSEVRVWNRTLSRSEALVSELQRLGVVSRVALTPQECVQEADVIVTATFATEPIVQDSWVKSDALIVAIGVHKLSELAPEIYKRAFVYVENKEAAKHELPGLVIEGELGEIALGKRDPPPSNKLAVFQSLGSAVEDAAVGSLILKLKSQQGK